MKRIVLFATLGLALIATAAAAHQYRSQYYNGHSRFSHAQHNGYRGTGCTMNSGITGGGMIYGHCGRINHNGTHRGMCAMTNLGFSNN